MRISKQVFTSMTDLDMLVDYVLDPNNKSTETVALSIANAVKEADEVVFDCTVGGSSRVSLYDPICLTNASH